jgi:putative addiction module CopG family antidote
MNVSLTPTLERLIKERVASGFYNNSSEVIREALRLLFGADRPAANQVNAAPIKQAIVTSLQRLAPDLRSMGVAQLYLVGSVRDDSATSTSDVDVLIDISEKSSFDLIKFVEIKDTLETALGHPVDLLTRDGLDPLIKDRVLAEAELIF